MTSSRFPSINLKYITAYRRGPDNSGLARGLGA